MYSNFLNIIDIIGTFAFAVSGVFSAMERRLDAFGVLIISFVTAIGGGTIRDVLVGNLPVNWLQNQSTILVILLSALLTIFFGTYLKQFQTALFLFDALGLGLFTIIGLEVGLKRGFNAGVCIALGTISACFGGVLRDVLLNKVPLIFQKESLIRSHSSTPINVRSAERSSFAKKARRHTTAQTTKAVKKDDIEYTSASTAENHCESQ